MFHQLIGELKNEGHEVCISARPLSNTISLLKQYQLDYEVIGRHYGKNIFSKLYGYPVRVMELRNFVKKHKPDIAVSQSSFHSPVVAGLSGIPSIYTNDNEHALGNKIAFRFASRILIPEVFPQKINESKKIVYPGIKEGIYLWSRAEMLMRIRANNPKLQDAIYIRPEPSTAQYYKGGIHFMDEWMEKLSKKHRMVILCRNQEQKDHYRESFKDIDVPDDPVSMEEIASKGKLFIGAGGTMTREWAYMGIPTVSVYQDKLLKADEWLVNLGRMYHEPHPTADKIEQCLAFSHDLKPDDTLYKNGKTAYEIFKKTILEYAG
jgi:predicted glycosyltransferase